MEGVSPETSRKARHDLEEIRGHLRGFVFPEERGQLLDVLRHDSRILNLCPSVRFAVESGFLQLAADWAGCTLAEFLGAKLRDVSTAVLLQGTHQEVVADASQFLRKGARTFKLKVGSRNIALDVKKVQDLRGLFGDGCQLRLDANRAWSLEDACLFATLAGTKNIAYIEEPLADPAQLGVFYEKTGMSIALDETLTVAKCGVRAPGRCSAPLAAQEAVSAYVLKPTLLGLTATLDWIEEARLLGRKALISAAFESPVALKVLANLACLSPEPAGLGTERWLQTEEGIVGEDHVIRKERL